MRRALGLAPEGLRRGSARGLEHGNYPAPIDEDQGVAGIQEHPLERR